ncbi:DNA gyrase inhibitor YacG [Paracoccus sp. S1E-3]|uniref:DNA gyrase inhibitor YacG n=1 Tax=Paracoccus sp. S1E-3 TaxID=2756130 RepID=UPI0015EE3CFC|nr:DNA gyrase inhibitor YacG [Paracoccus sp. S1E-3]MBA4492055.1 DNA gyrase inhibitor YacG [Paracoccus sp. S1E-3]
MATCPICGKPSVAPYRPFCSKRCADIDLAHWLRGDYVVPGNTAADDELVPERPVDEE